MEVVAAPPPSTGSSPFRDHDVREWSRIDSITGALERARLETDSWAATTRDATHRYGKVVDSRARTGTDGSLQAQASRQLEVFQSRAAGASLQVVKTTTVSSSRWSGKVENPVKGLGFEDLQLPLNPLDLTSEKSKASVGRSAHRRPPSRHPRATSSAFNEDLHHHIRNVHFTAATNLHRVSRLCHQIHESAVRNAFGRKSPTLSSRGSADGSVSGVEITEIESSATSNSDRNSHSTLTRAKSNSSEDVQQIAEKESGGLEELESWRRNSKIRRSLPFSKPGEKVKKPADIPESSVSVKKLRDELEKGRRLTTALRNNSLSGDLNAIDSIIQSISSASSLERSSIDDSLDENDKNQLTTKTKQKRESFVTVESLQEIKGRLRRTSSPGATAPSKQDDSDDGIGTSEDSKVKSYVYGMEKMLPNKKSIIGTGSLESRSKFANGVGTNKSEDWYNRRKSYGFEKVHSPENASSKSLKDKTLVESSTDSGICRSSEIMVVPTATKSNMNNGQTNGLCNSEESSESDVENKFGPNVDKSLNGIHYGNVKKMTSIFNQEDKNPFISSRSSDLAWRKKNELKSTTITIPIVKNNNVVDLPWNDEPEKDTSKRHSIAVDSNGLDNQLRKISLSNEVDEDNLNGIRRAKKVEFCKTEVHFAAESGKVNIVETDEKPPPTQNFRRRRRNSGPSTDYPPDFNKNGLPVLHFGDTVYEKSMYGVADPQENIPSAFSVVTVNSTGDSVSNHLVEYTEEERKDFNSIQLENDNLKGILKNKPIKPKPYHLGESVPLPDSDEDSKWGVKLRHVPKEQPIWKSTVTVRNTYQQDDESAPTSDLPEFQKLLKNLRPTNKKPDYMSDNENRYSDSFANIRVVPAAKDNRRSSWSVADRVKLDEEIQSSRGYSTKVNFGDGQATVVQNDQSTWPRVENLSKGDIPLDSSTVTQPKTTYNKYSIPNTNGGSKYSPVVLRKTIPLKPTGSQSPPTREFKNSPDHNLRAKCVTERAVLRQPKQSEMTYFGVGVTKTNKEEVVRKEQKPDLLHNHTRAKTPPKGVGKPRKPTPEVEVKQSNEHIYENIKTTSDKEVNNSKYNRNKDFDSAILDELTKAADQILQAVNGYTSEDCQNRLSGDEEDMRKPLDTISETKSWKNLGQDLESRNQQRMRPTLASAAKIKVKRTSSNSSVESLSRDRRRNSITDKPRTTTTAPLIKQTIQEKPRRKVSSEQNATSRSSTKARRLQRASSREALLQSHGSSSEDLPAIEAPVRKPRLIKKTKTSQLTLTNGIELKKPVRKSREEKKVDSKSDSRILGSLPEIRHKTAVSTITSTRDRSKTRNDENKSRNYTKKESNNKGTVSSSSTVRQSSSSKSSHAQRPLTGTREPSGVTQHRISTANIKRCHRAETATRH